MRPGDDADVGDVDVGDDGYEDWVMIFSILGALTLFT